MSVHASGWNHIQGSLETIISSRVRFVVQLQVRGFTQSPYLQGYFEPDHAATIELSSERNVSPGYATEQRESLVRLGWVRHTNPGLPNYIKFLTREESEASEIAAEFVKALSSGLKLSPHDVRIEWFEVEEPRIGA